MARWAGLQAVLASFALLCSLSVAGAAQKVDEATVRSAVQAAIDATTPTATHLSDVDAVAAFRAAIQSAIAKSGARPRIVRAALAKIACPGACATALSGVEALVGQLADLEARNERVASIGNSPLTSNAAFTASSFSAAPTLAGGGGGSGYTP